MSLVEEAAADFAQSLSGTFCDGELGQGVRVGSDDVENEHMGGETRYIVGGDSAGYSNGNRQAPCQGD